MRDYYDQEYDSLGQYVGGNGDGQITTDDLIDRNHDGVCTWEDNGWTEKRCHYWFDDGEGNLYLVMEDDLANEGLNKDDAIILSERYMKEYAENCNTLFISPTFKYLRGAPEQFLNFNDIPLKRVMDLADECGLKVFVYGELLHSLSGQYESLIDAENGITYDSSMIVEPYTDSKGNYVYRKTTVTTATRFKTQEDLNAFAIDYLGYICQHPSFFGISLRDEPCYDQLAAEGQVARAVLAAGEAYGKELFPMINLLPYAMSDAHYALYTSDGLDKDAGETYPEDAVRYTDSYMIYLNKYYEEAGQYLGYVMYDDYPLTESEYDINYTEFEDEIIRYYMHNHQMTAEFCAERGLRRIMAVQSYGTAGSNKTKRGPSQADMAWQINISLAFGCSEIAYYTWYPEPNGAIPDNFGEEYVVKRDGELNDLYYHIQDLNAQIESMSRALAHFTYDGLKYYMSDVVANDINQNYFFNGCGYAGCPDSNCKLVQSDLDLVVDLTMNFDGAILITQLYDDRSTEDTSDDVIGYYVVNITDPLEERGGKVTVKFNGEDDMVQMYKGTEIFNSYLSEDFTTTFSLSAGEGVFLMPYSD